MQDDSVGKGSCHQNWQNGFNPWDKYSGRREQTFTSCLLIFSHTCPQTHTFLCPFSRNPRILYMFSLITSLPKIISLLKFTHTLLLHWLVLFNWHTSPLWVSSFFLNTNNHFFPFYWVQRERWTFHVLFTAIS